MNQPVQLAGRRRAGILDAMSQGLAQPAVPRISIKAQRFTLVDSVGVQIPVQMFDGVGDPQRGMAPFGLYLDVVIIGVNPNKSRIYYENEYDPTKDEPPTCFSDNGVAPSSQATVPQSPTCAACPNAVWGSDTSKMTGKPTKLCNDRKKLAVIVVNDPAQVLYQLQVPPASLKNLGGLVTALRGHQVTDAEGQRPADPADVVTRIYFNPAKQGELLFQPMGFHQQMAPYIESLIEKFDAAGTIDAITGANDTPYQGAIALPNPGVAPMALPPPAQQMQAPPPPAPVQQVPQFQHQQPIQQQPEGFANGGGFQQPVAQPNFQQPTDGQQPAPQAPPPRTRRGGARAGAGRPAQNGASAPQPQPTAAPFQQQAPQQPVQQFAPPQAQHGQSGTPFGAAPAAHQSNMTGPTASPVAPTHQPSNPVPFQPQAAQPFTGQIPQQVQLAPNDPGPAPAFLVRNNLQPADTSAPQPGGAPAFGMTNGAAPDPGLTAALQNAFGAPLQPRQR